MKKQYGSLKLSIVIMEAKDVFLLASGDGGNGNFVEPDAGWPDGWKE